MAKQVKAIVKLQIKAGKANPAPPIGPALGQHGVNIMEFCKAYNERTKDMGEMVVPAELTIYHDRTFTFVLKTPPTAELVKKEISLPKGSAKPSREKLAVKITMAQIQKIAEVKLPDLNTQDMASALKTIAGSVRSMGLEVQL